MYLSIIIPTCNSGQFINKTLLAVEQYAAHSEHQFQIVIVDDSSSDQTYETLVAWGRTCKLECRLIQLFANRGQFRAIMAGMVQATGDCIVTLDDDLEYHPNQIDRLIEKLKEGEGRWDVVIGVPEKRKKNPWRIFSSWLTNEINTFMFGKPRYLRSGSFRIMTADFAKRLLEFQTANPVMGPLIFKATRRIANVTVEHQKGLRPSNYSLKKLLDTFVRNVQNFSEFPLRFISFTGLGIACISIFVVLFLALEYYTGFPRRIRLTGWTSLIASIWFLSGVILATVGLLGQYIYRIIEEVNKTPKFQIRNSVTFSGDKK